MDFEILRDMEQFTQEMFNNIIDFQEKKHPAWNVELNFAERIARLPLHYLVFSNADRDPEKFGPTVAHFYPLRQEMRTIAAYAKQVQAQAKVIDAHARNGFIGSLLANEGLRITGIRAPEEKPNQISSFYDSSVYEFTDTPLEQQQDIDLLLATWTPEGMDLSDSILNVQPKLVVFIFTHHRSEDTQLRQTGIDDGFGEKLSSAYHLVDEWEVTRYADLFHGVWPDLTPNIEETRTVRIFARDDVKNLVQPSIDNNDKYFWEHELLMAETAHEAKKQVMARGMPLNA
ncbi:MAG: hypothetical protein OEY38_05070 [Gammaproteobacteria bacterium]|nr:hypothetical protein [Gammaproteobacteria bacterium]